MIALVLLVILTGALYGTYFSVMRAREKGGERVEERRELSTTLGKLHQEIASALYASGDKRLHFVVEDRDAFGKPTSLLQFTTITPPRVDPAPASDLAVVRYSVQEKEGILSLMRESKDLYLDVKPLLYPIMDTVEGFSVECYDGGKWVKSWDTELNRRIPDKVRVTITLKGGEVFSTIASPGVKQ
ncbi:type II secretion system protein GspJ [Geomonas sp. RF6]|nr:type II secretion system protein GspJ [Geomonas sp. RF6]